MNDIKLKLENSADLLIKACFRLFFLTQKKNLFILFLSSFIWPRGMLMWEIGHRISTFQHFSQGFTSILSSLRKLLRRELFSFQRNPSKRLFEAFVGWNKFIFLSLEIFKVISRIDEILWEAFIEKSFHGNLNVFIKRSRSRVWSNFRAFLEFTNFFNFAQNNFQ